jgi:hypothetical protein
MRLNFSAPLCLLLLLAGCASAPPPRPAPAPQRSWSFPPDAFIRQRAVFTARGRQFALNGLLAKSEQGGLRLIVTENFGSVLADVLVKPDGTVFVMRSSRMFKPAWIRNYVAADLKCIFGATPPTELPVKMLDASHFVITRRWYTLDLNIVDTKPGPQSASMFDPAGAEKP